MPTVGAVVIERGGGDRLTPTCVGFALAWRSGGRAVVTPWSARASRLWSPGASLSCATRYWTAIRSWRRRSWFNRAMARAAPSHDAPPTHHEGGGGSSDKRERGSGRIMTNPLGRAELGREPRRPCRRTPPPSTPSRI